jgi:hypothetical protein
MLDPEHTRNAEDVRAGLNAVHSSQSALREHIIAIIRAWADARERYADLRSQWHTRAAQQLVFRIYHDIVDLEKEVGSRTRGRRGRSGVKFADALARFVGDLLRARAGTTGPALIFRAVGKSSFTHDPVKYAGCSRSVCRPSE